MPERLVQFENAEARPTPLLLLAELRTIDPRAELVYVGGGDWWLGAINPNDERTRKGQLILQQMDALDGVIREKPSIRRNIMLGRLLVQGFARIAVYHAVGEPSGTVTVLHGTPDAYETTMYRDFEERDTVYRHEEKRRQAFEHAQAEVNGVARKEAGDAVLRQYILNDGREHWHREIRNRVSFGYGGMTGGQGHSGLILPGAF